MLTIDDWKKTKVNTLAAKGEQRNIHKVAPLTAFVVMIRSKYPGAVKEAKDWNRLFNEFKRTGQV